MIGAYRASQQSHLGQVGRCGSGGMPVGEGAGVARRLGKRDTEDYGACQCYWAAVPCTTVNQESSSKQLRICKVRAAGRFLSGLPT